MPSRPERIEMWAKDTMDHEELIEWMEGADAYMNHLEEFIRNGVEYGYIERPEEDDPACATIDNILNEETTNGP